MADRGGVLLDLRAWTLKRSALDGEETVLTGVDLCLQRRDWVALLGANGSGKTSLLRYLAGTESPVTGSARLIAQDPDDQLIAATAAEELALAGAAAAAISDTLAVHGLAAEARSDPLLLSAGQKQRLQIAAALAGEPDLLLADEPTSLQDSAQAEWVLDRLAGWRAAGGTILMACQDERELRAADRLVLLDRGSVHLAGPVAELRDHPAVRALLDRARQSEPPPRAHGADRGAMVARWCDVGCRFGGRPGFTRVDLDLRAGDRLGLVGPNGCGKSTLLAAAVGLRPPDHGTVELCGRRLYARGRPDLDHGAALLAPQFPEQLFTRRHVGDEIALDPALASVGKAGVLADAGLPPACADRDPLALSTGQRRRLAVALVLRSRRPLLLLDEPTAALDAAGRRSVIAMLESVPEGSALAIASHDEGFLAACGCRILRLEPDGLRPATRRDA